MSRSGEVMLELGGEERLFRLGVGEWRKVQEQCDAGPAELLARMSPPFEAMRRGARARDLISAGLLGRWRMDDVRAPILHGLIGAGTPPNEAMAVVREWVDERPKIEPLAVAYQVVLASIVGVEDEDASGEMQGETDPLRSPAASSASDRTASTPSEPPQASAHAKSTRAPSGSSGRRSAGSSKRTAAGAKSA